MSKRCCVACAAFLNALGVPPLHAGTHSNVYPWACPPDTPVAAKQAVWNLLRAELIDYLDSHNTTPDSASGSEVGSSEAMWALEMMQDVDEDVDMTWLTGEAA